MPSGQTEEDTSLISTSTQGSLGYYRFPALYNDTIVFTAEGDLWTVGITGGVAQRLTTHHGVERHAAISPDGQWLAFSAEYEGAAEVYTMPLGGGLPQHQTYDGELPTRWGTQLKRNRPPGYGRGRTPTKTVPRLQGSPIGWEPTRVRTGPYPDQDSSPFTGESN
jgi:hypothetical protein